MSVRGAWGQVGSGSDGTGSLASGSTLVPSLHFRPDSKRQPRISVFASLLC